MSNYDWAWAAGLYEGEGTVYLHKGYPRLALVMTDEDVVSRFADVIGVPLDGPYERGDYKLQWRAISYDREQIAQIMKRFSRYLGERRLAQWKEVLANTKPLERGVPTGIGDCGFTKPVSQNGYRRHKARGEQPCDSCRLAYNEYQRQLRSA